MKSDSADFLPVTIRVRKETLEVPLSEGEIKVIGEAIIDLNDLVREQDLRLEDEALSYLFCLTIAALLVRIGRHI